MVFCIIGLVIFGILGIFSAKYRAYAKEAWRCLKRQVTLRPCDTEFDKKIRAKIAGKFIRFPKISKTVYKIFPALSWAMVIMLFVSIYWTGLGIYNTVQYGNCNGPGSHDFCIFDPIGSSELHEKIMKLKPISAEGDPTIGPSDAPVKIVEVGCFRCPYTRDSESIRNQIMNKYKGNVSFTFRIMPLPNHNLSKETGEAALCALDQDKYWQYHDKLFENQGNMSVQKINEIAQGLGLNMAQFDNCTSSRKYSERLDKNYKEGMDAGIFATPTYFINGKPIVGVNNFAGFEQIVAEEIKGTCEVS